MMILFHPDYEEWEQYRCKENEVALLMYYPAAEEDTIGYMDFKNFILMFINVHKNIFRVIRKEKKKSLVC